MGISDQRTDPRKKVCLQAFAADVNDTFDVKCIIRNVSKGGCMIVSSCVHELPDLVHIVPQGFDKPLAGKIVWRGEKLAGVSFVSTNDEAVLTEVKDYFVNMVAASEDGYADGIEGLVRPRGYADRLARFGARNKK